MNALTCYPCGGIGGAFKASIINFYLFKLVSDHHWYFLRTFMDHTVYYWFTVWVDWGDQTIGGPMHVQYTYSMEAQKKIFCPLQAPVFKVTLLNSQCTRNVSPKQKAVISQVPRFRTCPLTHRWPLQTHPHYSITHLTPSIYRDGPIRFPNWYCSPWHAPAWGNVFITPIFPNWNTQPPLPRSPGVHDTLRCWRQGNESDDDRSSYSPWVLPTKASHVSACWGEKRARKSQGCADVIERESCNLIHHLPSWPAWDPSEKLFKHTRAFSLWQRDQKNGVGVRSHQQLSYYRCPHWMCAKCQM